MFGGNSLFPVSKYGMLCAIWYHLYNFKTVKSTYEGLLLSVKLLAFKAVILLKVTLLH